MGRKATFQMSHNTSLVLDSLCPSMLNSPLEKPTLRKSSSDGSLVKERQRPKVARSTIPSLPDGGDASFSASDTGKTSASARSGTARMGFKSPFSGDGGSLSASA